MTDQFSAIFHTLQVTFLSDIFLLNACLLQPWLDAHVLSVEVAHVRHNVLYNIHVRQRVDLGRLTHICIDFAAKNTSE